MPRHIITFVLLAGLAACTTGPDYERPHFDLPATWPEHVLLSPDDQQDCQAWWTRFA